MRFDHLNLRPRDMEAMRDFLVAVLDLKVGWRPPFTFPGYWLYDADDRPVIHLQPPGDGDQGTQPLFNHMAFGPYDLDARQAAISALGYACKRSRIPGTGIDQLFVIGPENIRVELQSADAGRRTG